MIKDIQSTLQGKPFLANKKEIIALLNTLLTSSIASSITKERVGIAFSGGVDSTILAHLYNQHSKNYTLYTVGLEGSKDLEQAAIVALKMKFPLKIRIITKQEALDIIDDVTMILDEAGLDPNPIDIAIASVIYAALLMARKDNMTTLLYGLGMDSIFAGFEHHTNYKKDFTDQGIQDRLWSSLHHLETTEMARDQALAKFTSMKLIAPFLNKELVTYAMQIPPSMKVNKEEKKIILRETAINLGIPKDVADNKKTAAQYGSGFMKLMKAQKKKDREE